MCWLLLVLNKAPSVFSEAGGGGHWLLLKSLLSVLAVSLSSGAPLQHIKRCPKTKLLCVVFFFPWPQRQIANEAPVSKLRSDFGTLVSGFSSHCKKNRDFISLLSFLQLELSSKGFLNLLFGFSEYICLCRIRSFSNSVAFVLHQKYS